MPLQAIDFANDLLDRAEEMADVAGTPAGTDWVVEHDILRSAWIFVGSSLDTYFHERVRRAILRTPISTKAAKYPIGLGAVDGMVASFLRNRAGSRPRVVLNNIVHEALLKDTFQGSTNIEKAFSMIGAGGYWQAIGTSLGETPAGVKSRLDQQYARRNRIAHQGDYTRQARPQQFWYDLLGRGEVDDEIVWTRSFLAAADVV